MACDSIEGTVGEEISAVSFVCDYVELHMDGPVIRLLTPPRITTAAGECYAFPGAGSRDALCSIIGSKIAGIRIREDDVVRIRGDTGWEVVASLVADESTGWECMHFVPGPNLPIQVW